MPMQQRQQLILQQQVGQQNLVSQQQIAASQVLQSNAVVTGHALPQQQSQQQILQPPSGLNVNQPRLTYSSTQQTRVCT